MNIRRHADATLRVAIGTVGDNCISCFFFLVFVLLNDGRIAGPFSASPSPGGGRAGPGCRKTRPARVSRLVQCRGLPSTPGMGHRPRRWLPNRVPLIWGAGTEVPGCLHSGPAAEAGVVTRWPSPARWLLGGHRGVGRAALPSGSVATLIPRGPPCTGIHPGVMTFGLRAIAAWADEGKKQVSGKKCSNLFEGSGP